MSLCVGCVTMWSWGSHQQPPRTPPPPLCIFSSSYFPSSTTDRQLFHRSSQRRRPNHQLSLLITVVTTASSSLLLRPSPSSATILVACRMWTTTVHVLQIIHFLLWVGLDLALPRWLGLVRPTPKRKKTYVGSRSAQPIHSWTESSPTHIFIIIL